MQGEFSVIHACSRISPFITNATFFVQTEFCYLCQALWKNCPCPQWDETRLVGAAEEQVDIQVRLEAALRPERPVLERWRHHPRHQELAIRPVAIPPNREQLIQAAVAELRVNHDCRHERWGYRDGGGMCAGCHDVLDRYVLVSVGLNLDKCVI